LSLYEGILIIPFSRYHTSGVHGASIPSGYQMEMNMDGGIDAT